MVVARFLTVTSIECVSPALAAIPHISEAHNDSINTMVGVAEGAWVMQHQHLLRLPFAYHKPLHVTHLSPSHGPLHGGTFVVLEGHFSARGDMVQSASCAFNETVVAATRLSDHELLCASPAMSAGFSTVEVSYNIADWSTSGRWRGNVK
jgi:hypothetical protein